MTNIGILGVAFEAGASKPGCYHGPTALRQYGLIEKLNNIHAPINVKDYGDVKYTINKMKKHTLPKNMHNYENIASLTPRLSKKCCKIIKDGRICVTIGGDHSLAIGTVSGHVKAKSAEDVALLWIDVHADLNMNSTSESGNIHGMPVAVLAKEMAYYWPRLPCLEEFKSVISIRNIAYIGLRSVDPMERYFIDKLGIAAFGMKDIENYGIDAVVSMALERIDPLGKSSLHVSFDFDSLDSLEAPSTETPVRGGLTLCQGINIMETIHATNRLGALDLVELNPKIGDGKDINITLEAACQIILSALGQSRRGLWPLTDTVKQI